LQGSCPRRDGAYPTGVKEMTEEVTTYPDALERLIESLRPDALPEPFEEDVMELPLHP
jgi:hypothetical protein